MRRLIFDLAQGIKEYRDLTQAELDAYNALQTKTAAETAAAEVVATELATAIASDKTLVQQFMNSARDQPTKLQIEDTLRAVIRYLRRRGDDA